jgi:5-methylcytosine-specific restriction endonuclease McrA
MLLDTRRKALDAGEIRYFTGNPCAQGHIAERFAKGGGCVACGLDRSNKRYEALRDKLKAQRMVRYYADPAKYITLSAEYAANNKEKVAEHRKAWWKRNPDKRVAWEHARLARKAAAGGRYTADDIQVILYRQKSCCANPYCGIDISEIYTVDHVTPLTRGGDNWPSNLQLLCQPCNSSKGNKTMDEWLARQAVSIPTHLRRPRGSFPIPTPAGEAPQD